MREVLTRTGDRIGVAVVVVVVLAILTCAFAIERLRELAAAVRVWVSGPPRPVRHRAGPAVVVVRQLPMVVSRPAARDVERSAPVDVGSALDPDFAEYAEYGGGGLRR